MDVAHGFEEILVCLEEEAFLVLEDNEGLYVEKAEKSVLRDNGEIVHAMHIEEGQNVKDIDVNIIRIEENILNHEEETNICFEVKV